MPAVQARIVNTDHTNATLSYVEDLPTLTWTFKRSDTGSASWVVPLSHPNLERVTSNDPNINGIQPAGFGPKLTDFRIGVSTDGGVNWNTVHAGICGPVGLDSDKDSVEVAGLDWLVWLNQPYRFTGYSLEWDTVKPTADDLIRYWLGSEISIGDARVIIGDLINNLCSDTELQCVQLSYDFSGSGTWDTDYITLLKLGDTTSVLDAIKALSAFKEPLGFEGR